MKNKKNRFFTLIFSCCPGAGEMYMGLYKQGIGLMGLFFGAAAVAFWLNWEELLFFICPVVWCYSFFHTHNLRHMTEEEFGAVEDKFFFEDYVKDKPDWRLTKKHRRFFGLLLFLLGLSIVWRELFDILGTFLNLPHFMWQIGQSVPQLAMAALVIYGALRLMKEPKEAETAAEETEPIRMEENEA